MYYIVKEIAQKPYLQFELIASSEEELISKGYTASSPKIVLESVMVAIPFGHGIFLKELNAEGDLVDRDVDQVNASITENAPILKTKLRAKLLTLSNEILLATKLGESTTNLQADFDATKADYDAIVIT